MRENIHPKYVEAKVICSCGEVFTTRSTSSEIKIEICSKCHPFYTGKQKFVDSGGRVERFQKKFGSVMERAEKETQKTEEEKKETTVQKEQIETVEEVEEVVEEQTAEDNTQEQSTETETEESTEEPEQENS